VVLIGVDRHPDLAVCPILARRRLTVVPLPLVVPRIGLALFTRNSHGASPQTGPFVHPGQSVYDASRHLYAECEIRSSSTRCRARGSSLPESQ
jgi:hypothetical protein